MTSITHDIMTRLLRRRREIIPLLLAAAGHPVRAGKVELSESQLPAEGPGADLDEAQRRSGLRPRFADLAVLCGEGADRRVIICEVQTSKPSSRQRRRQFAYLANAADLNGCDAYLLVVTAEPWIARVCGRPFWPGHPMLVLIPVVSGPHNTPLPDAPGMEPFAAELAVLGVLNGNLDMSMPATFKYVTKTIWNAGCWPAEYTDFLRPIVSPAVRTLLEATMLQEKFYTPFLEEARVKGVAEGEARGEARGEAKMLLGVLAARGIAVPEDVENQIRSCTDAGQFGEWVLHAATADVITDVFPARNGHKTVGSTRRESAA